MSDPDIRHGFSPQVQSYVDGELAAAEREEFRRAMAGDPMLRAEVERLVALKQCLREAWPVRDADMPRARYGRVGLWASAAALLVGIAVGFLLAQAVPGRAPALGQMAELGSRADVTRVLLHVGTADTSAMNEALLSARYILDDFAESRRPLRIHVVANGPGLDLLRLDRTSHAEQIATLERDYPNIQFVACQNTIERVEDRSKQPVTLLPQALRVDSGVADIARKRAVGWLYIGV